MLSTGAELSSSSGAAAALLRDELSLLHSEDFRDDAKYPAALQKLVRSLREPNPKLGGLFAVPSLPPHFLGRPELMRRIRDALHVDLQKPQVITSADARVGVQGMGGIGKSVLAAALARNREVRQSYPDGIIWVSCGQHLTRDDLLARQRDVARSLGGDGNFDSLPQGQGVLRELLAAKAALLVLDDVWQASDAQAFDVLGPRCRMLVTTRDAGILHALHGELVPVSLFTEPEALRLLADAVGVERSTLPSEALEVIKECGCLPLAVTLSGGMAKKRGGDFHSVLERLRRADLDKIADRESINEQHRSIWRAMQASVEMLPEDEQKRFAELAVFANDSTVPETAVATLWFHAGNLDDLDTEDLLINLSERSLIQLDQKSDGEGKVCLRFTLHDLLHDYAVRIAGDLKVLHHALLDAYRRKCSDGWHSGPNDGYFFENLPRHLVDMEAWPEAGALLTDFSWLMRKCEIGLLDSISADYGLIDEKAPADLKKPLEVWQAFFREKAHIFRRGNEQWLAHKILLQLAGEDADDSALTIAAEQWLASSGCNWPWLRRIQRLSHVQKNSCLAVLEGHTGGIYGALELADGRLLSWSNDNTLRLWDGKNGVCQAVLGGHTNDVTGALELTDGRLLSWSGDKTLRLWNGKSGECLEVLDGHTNGIRGALILAEGRLLSWSYDDNTLRLWDGKNGACLAVLDGHANIVTGALELADGRLLSWSGDNTLQLWDSKSGACLAVLDGHTNGVNGALELANGRLLSWSSYEYDNKLRLWDSQNGRCIKVFEGHTGSVHGVRPVSDGRLLSWAEGFLSEDSLLEDNNLRLWDGENGACLAVLEGHTGEVNGALALADGRLLSWGDETLRLWDGENGACLAVLDGHSVSGVTGALELSDGRLLSWSSCDYDNKLRLWDSQNGRFIKVLQGHTKWVNGMLALANGRLLSWSEDETLRLWDGEDGACLAVLEGHTGMVRGALALAEGRLLSWSDDRTLRLWDSKSGACLATLDGPTSFICAGVLGLAGGRLLSWPYGTMLRLWDSENGVCQAVLEGHTNDVTGALELTDGRLLSWSGDKTLRLWNGKSGACLAVIDGHTSIVIGALELADGRLLSWSRDNTLRLWDGNSGTRLAALEGHTDIITGALELADGRLLSWSGDNTLRRWDGESGACLTVFDGCNAGVEGGLALANGRLLGYFTGALALDDGRLLSWSCDKMLQLWDANSGACLKVLRKDQAAINHPEWLHARAKAQDRGNAVVGNFFVDASACTAHILHRTIPSLFAAWNTDSNSCAHFLLPDGTMAVTQQNGQVCILKLHHGNHRVSLAEAESLLQNLQKETAC